jgi:hypothetical protein
MRPATSPPPSPSPRPGARASRQGAPASRS